MALRGSGGCGTGVVDLWGAGGRVRVARREARPGRRRAGSARAGGRAARPEGVSLVRRRAGARAPDPPPAPLLELQTPTPVVGAALRVSSPPPLDGTLDGFDTSEPLRLELEDQYRRSEEPYPGPDDFAAVAHAAWDDDA